jgi:hypothetical protein
VKINNEGDGAICIGLLGGSASSILALCPAFFSPWEPSHNDIYHKRRCNGVFVGCIFEEKYNLMKRARARAIFPCTSVRVKAL